MPDHRSGRVDLPVGRNAVQLAMKAAVEAAAAIAAAFSPAFATQTLDGRRMKQHRHLRLRKPLEMMFQISTFDFDAFLCIAQA